MAESPALNKTIFEHAPNSRGAQDYEALLEELVGSGFFTGTEMTLPHNKRTDYGRGPRLVYQAS